jgi:integrase
MIITSVKLILDTRRLNKHSAYPIRLRIIHRKQTRYITTEYSISDDDWDDEAQSVKPTCKKYRNNTRVNNHLHTILITAADAITKLQSTRNISEMSINDVRASLETTTTSVSFKDFTEKIIKEFKLAKKLGNAGVYEQALNFLERNSNRKNLTFDDINFQLLKSLEAKFLSEDNSLNGLSFYLRTIRAIYNRAIKEGVASRDNYPFTSYSIKETKTRKRAIRKTDMDNIKKAVYESGSIRWHVRNLFLFSFYNRGMNFADMAKLRISDIEGDRITYKRAKTGKPLSIKISDASRVILNNYVEGKSGDDFVFPILKRDTPELQMMDLYNERRNFNNYLKKIGEELEIEGHLTSYVARHSWATIAKDMNVPVSVISEGLGHADIKTTQIYLDSFDDDVLDEANKLITG